MKTKRAKTDTEKVLPPEPLQHEKALITVQADAPDSLTLWAEAYFRFEVTTSERSQREQKRDLKIFLEFLFAETGSDERMQWTPRFSRAFIDYLRAATHADGKRAGERRWNNRTINRMIAHLKTFARWVHKLRPFPLGDPMAKVGGITTASTLDIEKALTGQERRRLLDAADLMPASGGLSKDRNRYKQVEARPRRKGYRPYRNRAIIYALIETGMRRGAVTRLNLADIDFAKRTIKAQEKGGHVHCYHISRDGIRAIAEYIEEERGGDAAHWETCPALFLTAATIAHGSGRLNEKTINNVWDAVCKLAGVNGRTPHAARHAMGRHIIEKTGNIAAVQRQLGHKNAAYSMQYARITAEELNKVLDER